MNILDLVVLVIILVPGIYWTTIDSELGSKKNLKIRELFVRVVLFNFVILIVVGTGYELSNVELSYYKFINNNWFFDRSELKDEILWSFAVSFFLSKIWLRITFHRKFRKFFDFVVNVSSLRRHDIWANVFNSSYKNRIIRVIDNKHNRTYIGKVVGSSYIEEDRELLLADVKVYSSVDPNVYKERDAEFEQINSLYISFKRDDCCIEIIS